MKPVLRLLSLLLFFSIGVNAQYSTQTQLYDSISSGPFIEPEGSGYNFYFLTEGTGTMVSTRGLVTNPALTYRTFNHYHLHDDGQVDSIFTIGVRADVNHHYTMYQRGAPKILQFRVGTSNDPSFEKIKSKYPILGAVNINDESLNLNSLEVSEKAPFKYNLTSLNYNQGKVSKKENKAIIEVEEGWILKSHISANSIDHPESIISIGKIGDDDKENKFNDLKELKFITLDQSGKILFEKEFNDDRAYLSDHSGLVHDLNGQFAGFFLTLTEAGGTKEYKKANEDYNSGVRKILLFDADGKYYKEVELNLPFEPKAKEMGDQKILKVIKTENDHIVLLKTNGNKKQRIGEGFYTYLVQGKEAKEINFQKDIDLEISQSLQNESIKIQHKSIRYDYVVKLQNGKLVLFASEYGNDLRMIILDEKGNLEHTGFTYLANNIIGSQAKLTFEHLDRNKVLIVSKVADQKSVFTSYSILDGNSGVIRNIQPEQKLNKIHSYRNGDDILVYGSSIEDEKHYHFVLEKLSSKEAGITMDLD